MEEQLRDKYFLIVRMGLLIGIQLYIVISEAVFTGASAQVLLFLAVFIGIWTAGEWVSAGKYRYILVILAFMTLILYLKSGKGFVLLGIYLCYEALFHIKPAAGWYILPLMASFIPVPAGFGMRFVIAVLLAIVYMQNDFVVESYKKQMQQDIKQEQHLKHNIYRKESEMREEVKRGLMHAENQILEARESLSQTLHDKLGHNINGSVYQLEAVKLLMEKEPDTSRKMIQAVIDQLRIGMDEIRMILRNERPPRYRLSILQLEKLCEGCREKGIDAELSVEGDQGQVPDEYLEVILDNAYEAVSNSLKYSNCTKIHISLIVLNRIIRCTISDNGAGCSTITDGMGITGMRRRIREMNGTIDFAAEAGFTINMLLPIPDEMEKDVWKK